MPHEVITMELNERQQAARTQFDKQSGRYGKSHILADTSDVAALLDGLDLPAGATALDVATGGGHTALLLAKRGCHVRASDISAAMVEAARKLAADEGYVIETAEHVAEVLPYESASFDLVTCRVAAHHFSDVPAFAAETARVLRPGGYLLLIDGSIPDHAPEAEEWIHQVEKFRDPSHGRFLSPLAWRRICEHAGLEVLRCETSPMKQPDLEWYFETAATSPENRSAVRRLIEEAPASAAEVFRLATEEGKTVWWWLRLGLLARKP